MYKYTKKENYGELRIEGLQLLQGDIAFRINSQLHLIEGINELGQLVVMYITNIKLAEIILNYHQEKVGL